MWINGLTNKVDVINSIIDNIDDNDLATARDSLNQLKDIETIPLTLLSTAILLIMS